MPCVVSVAGDEVHQITVHQQRGDGLGSASEAAQQRSRGNLHQRAVFHPGLQLIEAGVQQGVALRVRDDRGETGPLQAVENFLCGAGDEQVREFDQQIAEMIDGVPGGICQRVLYVLQGEMKIAAAVDAGEGAVLACGVATMSVVPESAARRSIATESSRVLAPSSRPDSMWL